MTATLHARGLSLPIATMNVRRTFRFLQPHEVEIRGQLELTQAEADALNDAVFDRQLVKVLTHGGERVEGFLTSIDYRRVSSHNRSMRLVDLVFVGHLLAQPEIVVQWFTGIRRLVPSSTGPMATILDWCAVQRDVHDETSKHPITAFSVTLVDERRKPHVWAWSVPR